MDDGHEAKVRPQRILRVDARQQLGDVLADGALGMAPARGAPRQAGTELGVFEELSLALALRGHGRERLARVGRFPWGRPDAAVGLARRG
jgi:hypothetical protein